jgi:hypothetical protein
MVRRIACAVAFFEKSLFLPRGFLIKFHTCGFPGAG